jgi:hypothetical protein
MRKRIYAIGLLLLLPVVSQAEVKSKYLKTSSESYRKLYENHYKKSKKQEKKTYSKPAPSWTAFGQLAGKVDNLLIIKTKDGNYLLKKDYR